MEVELSRNSHKSTNCTVIHIPTQTANSRLDWLLLARRLLFFPRPTQRKEQRRGERRREEEEGKEREEKSRISSHLKPRTGLWIIFFTFYNNLRADEKTRTIVNGHTMGNGLSHELWAVETPLVWCMLGCLPTTS